MKQLWGKGLLALLIKGASVVAIVAAVSTITVSAQAATMTEALGTKLRNCYENCR